MHTVLKKIAKYHTPRGRQIHLVHLINIRASECKCNSSGQRETTFLLNAPSAWPLRWNDFGSLQFSAFGKPDMSPARRQNTFVSGIVSAGIPHVPNQKPTLNAKNALPGIRTC
jgi:hypothetical protein